VVHAELLNDEADFTEGESLVKGKQDSIVKIHPSGRQGRAQAFSLIELLVVIAIMAILAVTVTPGISSVSRDLNLISGGSRISDELNFARQQALSGNQIVEVRFYQDANNNNVYDTMVSLIPTNPNVAGSSVRWLEKPNVLPGSVVFDTNSGGGVQYSPLLTTLSSIASPQASTSDNTSGTPYRLRGEHYVAFHFRPDGSTDLDGSVLTNASTSQWWLTLYDVNSPGTTLPANFVTVLLDPVTGRTRIYQPH
jgi:uncharacterized protein (TIGR02596 family)